MRLLNKDDNSKLKLQTGKSMLFRATSMKNILVILVVVAVFLWFSASNQEDFPDLNSVEEVYRYNGNVQQYGHPAVDEIGDDDDEDRKVYNNSQDEVDLENLAGVNIKYDGDTGGTETLDRKTIQMNRGTNTEWTDVDALVGKVCPIPDEVYIGVPGVHRIIVSSTDCCANICVSGTSIVGVGNNYPGLTFVEIDRETGAVTKIRTFHTGKFKPTQLREYFDSIPDGRIVAGVTYDEAAIHLDGNARAAIADIGSWKIDALEVGGAWAIVGVKGIGYPTLFESVGMPSLHTDVDDKNVEELRTTTTENEEKQSVTAYTSACIGNDTTHNSSMREESMMTLCSKPYGRSKFCQQYTDVKLMSNMKLKSEDMNFRWPIPAPWDENLVADIATKIPVVIVAGNRTNYLIRHLKALFKQPGLNPRLVGVYTDGVHDDIAHAARIFGVRVYAHTKSRTTSTRNSRFQAADRIAMSYRFTLDKVWRLYPEHENTIVLEEDLEVAPDFLHYFSQTIPLLAEDHSLLSISAWNDNSMEWTSADPARLYLSEFFTGLGWVLTKRLWSELEPKWPECCQGFSWDLWLRHNSNTKGRKTIIPDVSRTFHFGRKGSNVNNDYFYVLYFAHHSFNKHKYTQLANLDRMKEADYDADLDELFSKATPAIFAGDARCPFHIPDLADSYDSEAKTPNYESPIVLWYDQGRGSLKFKNLEKLISCFKMWDLGKARCNYKNVIRGFIGNRHLLLAGVKSPWAKKYMRAGDYVVRISAERRKRQPEKHDIIEVKKLRSFEDV